MASSLTKKDRVIMTIGSIILLGYMVMLSLGEEAAEPEGKVKGFFTEVLGVLGFIVQNFTFPVITSIILGYAVLLSRKSRENKWGFLGGLALCAVAIWMHRVGLIPACTTPSDVLWWEVLIYLIVSALSGFVFLYLLDVVANRPISGLLVSLMTVASLVSFYFYYFYEFLQFYLFPIALAIFFGGCFYKMTRKIQKKEK